MLFRCKKRDEFLKTLNFFKNKTYPRFFKTSKYIIYVMINQFYFWINLKKKTALGQPPFLS